jgi:hypothetical protein
MNLRPIIPVSPARVHLSGANRKLAERAHSSSRMRRIELDNVRVEHHSLNKREGSVPLAIARSGTLFRPVVEDPTFDC